jgi:hypothetical protein
MKNFLLILTFFLSISLSDALALNRDYKSDCDEDNSYQFYYQAYCLKHAPNGYPSWISPNLYKLIPAEGIRCCKCYDQSSYLGYTDPDFEKYRSHLERQLKYFSQHKSCKCYWPEFSSEAAKISDLAYILFRNLISTTALSSLLNNESAQRDFI